MSYFVLCPRGDWVPCLNIMRFSMFSRFACEQLQRIIAVTAESSSENAKEGENVLQENQRYCFE